MFQCSPSLPRDCFLHHSNTHPYLQVSMFSLVTKGLFLMKLMSCYLIGQCFNVLPRYQGIVSEPLRVVKPSLRFNVLPRYQGIVSPPILAIALVPDLVSMFSLVTKGLFPFGSLGKKPIIWFQCSPSLPRDCFRLDSLPVMMVVKLVSMFSLVTKGLFLSPQTGLRSFLGFNVLPRYQGIVSKLHV